MRKLVLACFLVCGFFFAADAQEVTVDELKAMKAEKQAAIDALTGEIGDLEKQIKQFPGWKFGGVGIIGFNLNSNNNWYFINNPQSTNTGLNFNASAFANKDEEKFFWNNLASLTYNVQSTKISEDAEAVKSYVDILDISSIGGYKLAPKWALTAKGTYTTPMRTFNNIGTLRASLGATWKPITNLVVNFHPLAYEFNWPGDLVSVPGCEIGATYAANILPGIAWSSNLSAFIPYSAGTGTLNQFPIKADSPMNNPEYDTGAAALSSLEVPYSTGGLTNWTWVNSFSANIWRGIGVAFSVGLKSNAQLANQWQYQRNQTYNPNVEANNPLQSYYTLGLAYTL